MNNALPAQNNLNDLQMRGRHTLFVGDVVTVFTTNGLVRMHTQSLAEHATLTPEQADELARDLQAYAEAARREGRAA